MYCAVDHGGHRRATEAVKNSQGPLNAAKQTALPLLAAMHKPAKNAPAALLRQIESEAQAIAVAMQASGSKLAYIAACLGKSISYVSLIRAGKRPVPDWFVEPFCRVTGTNLLRQFRDLQDAMLAMEEPDHKAVVKRLAAALRSAA